MKEPTPHKTNKDISWGLFVILALIAIYSNKFSVQTILICFAAAMTIIHITPILSKIKKDADIYGYAKQKIPFLMGIMKAIGQASFYIISLLFILTLVESPDMKQWMIENKAMSIGIPFLIVLSLTLFPIIKNKRKAIKSKEKYTLPTGVNINSKNDVWSVLAWTTFWALITYMSYIW